MPRRKKGEVVKPNPYRAKDIVSVSVNQPDQMLFFFKLLVEQREVEENARIPIRQLYEEAVRELLDDIRDGKPIFFTITPLRGITRRTIWLLPDTAEEVKKCTGDNIHLSQFVLTALLRYMERHGQTFEGFPTTYEEFMAKLTPAKKP
jgi:hypothetical protein